MKNAEFKVTGIGEILCDENGFRIRINPENRQSMLGLQGFSHIQIYWWANELDKAEYRKINTVEKPYKKGPQQLGIFATRSPMRPNPIAMTLVPVTYIDDNEGIIGIAYIDANPGTPVLDIKPYYGTERVKQYSVPDWCAHWPQWYEDAGSFDWAAEFENAR